MIQVIQVDSKLIQVDSSDLGLIQDISGDGSMSLRIPTIQNFFGLKISEPINFQFQAAF